MDEHIAEFGSTRIKRAFCKYCDQYALVIDGELQCCDRPCGEEKPPKRIKKMSLADGRRGLSLRSRRDILREQDYRCLYCNQTFGDTVRRKSRRLRLRIEFDHAIPFAFCADTKAENMVAACHVCNGIKSSRIYGSLDEARTDLMFRREEKGYNF